MDYFASCTLCIRLNTSNRKVAYTKPIQVNDIFRPMGIDFAEYVHPNNPYMYVLGLLLVKIDFFSRNGRLNTGILFHQDMTLPWMQGSTPEKKGKFCRNVGWSLVHQMIWATWYNRPVEQILHGSESRIWVAKWIFSGCYLSRIQRYWLTSSGEMRIWIGSK